jgi:arylsulfatase A-like enzyme
MNCLLARPVGRRIAVTILACAALTLAARAATPRQPNFLFVYTDDQRWDAMSVVQREHGEKGRFPWFKTPNMDRIAAEGIRFRNAFVVSSLCAPSRAAFMTAGTIISTASQTTKLPSPEDSVTHSTLLRPAGYVTAYIGKWHMGGQTGKRAGFDYSASFIGQGRYVDCPFEINGTPTPTTGWVDDVSTDYAIEFIKQHRAQPFSVVVGFKACHGPFEPPERAKTRFADARARTVPNLSVRAIYRENDEAPAGKKKGGERRFHRDQPRLFPLHLRGRRQPWPAAEGARRSRDRRRHRRGVCQRQRLLPRRARPRRQALRLRRVAAHSVPRPLSPAVSPRRDA